MQYLIALVFPVLLALYYYLHPQPEISKNRRILLVSLRSLMLYILVLLIISPILHFQRQRRIAPKVLFLTDNSASMDLEFRGGAKGAFLKGIAEPMREKYRDAGYDVQDYTFADGLQGAKDNSLLAKTFEDLSAKERLDEVAAIVLASDGWLRDEELGIINRLGIPVHTLADSSAQSIPDLEVSAIDANRYAYRNEPTVFRARVKASNYSGPATLNLFIGQSRVAAQNVNLEPDTEIAVDFTHRFTNVGFFNYRVEMQPLDKEKRLGNNNLPGAIEVLAEKEHILVFSDSPAWDNKFIIDAIASNPRWDSKAYQIKDGKLLQGEKPVSLESGAMPAVIVMINNGKLRPDAATIAYIKNAVNRGAGILYQGLPLAELADILPITRSNILNPYQGFVTTLNAATKYQMLSDLIRDAAKLPPMDYYYVTPTKNSEVLATMNNPQNSPAIVIAQGAKGRSLGMSILNLWRWQLQSPEGGYQKMMVNILTWLSNKALGAYSAIYKSSYLQGEEIRIRLRAEDEIRGTDLDGNPQITIYNEDGKELTRDFMTREGSEYSFVSDISEPGQYRFEINEAGKKSGGRFLISKGKVEDRDFDFNLPLLQYISSESRGKTMFDAAYSPVPAQIIERIESRDLPLYKKWYVLSLFILAFCLELYLRRRWGLL